MRKQLPYIIHGVQSTIACSGSPHNALHSLVFDWSDFQEIGPGTLGPFTASLKSGNAQSECGKAVMCKVFNFLVRGQAS